MKKRVIAVMMAAMMAMSMAACGDKENAPADGMTSGDGTGSVSTEESSGESDASEDGSGESTEESISGEQESQPEEESTEEADASGTDTPQNTEGESTESDTDDSLEAWVESVDWNRVIYTASDGSEFRAQIFIGAAVSANLKQQTAEEFMNDWFNMMEEPATYDVLDDDAKALLDKLMTLNLDEITYVQNEVLGY